MQMTRTGRWAVTLTTLAMGMALSACDGGEGVRAATASRAGEPPPPRSAAPWDARTRVWPDERCRGCTVAAAIRSSDTPARADPRWGRAAVRRLDGARAARRASWRT
jgi:hypothetical protein